jgi:hypothetical protein
MWNKLAGLRKDDCGRTKQRLSAYLDRRLSPEDQRRVEQHLADCRGCQEELHSLEATVALLHRLPQVSPSRSFRIARTEPSRRWTPVPALRLATVGAAMLLIMAFTADLVNFFDTPLSPVGQEDINFSYNDNRSAAMEGGNKADAGTLTPGDGQEPGLPSDGALGSTEAAWVRPLVYGLAGLVVVLGGVTAWLWLRPKRRPGHRPT